MTNLLDAMPAPRCVPCEWQGTRSERAAHDTTADHRKVVEWRRNERARRQELRRVEALAHQVIDAGYRAVAARLHPDVGGSHDDMVRLVTVRDSLKEWSPDPTVYQVYRARRSG